MFSNSSLRKRPFFAARRFALSLRNSSRWLVQSILAAALVLAAAYAPAKVYIDINAPSVRRIPVAVPLLKRSAAGASDASVVIAETLRSDLGFSGLFDMVDPRAYLEDPQKALVVPDSKAFSDWLTVGAEVLIKGQVDLQADGITVELRAYEVFRQSQFLGKRYTASAADARTIAHMFANSVLEEFTGTVGPYGTLIAYVTQQGKSKELSLADMDGSHPRRLTRTGSLSINPSWSRDGRYLYYTSFMRGEPDLYLLDLSTWKNWVVSRSPGINLSGKDSPDGKELLLSLSKDGNSEIYRMDKSTRALTRLTENRAIEVAPTWSPDGRQIAFVSDRMGNPHIFVMDRDGRNVRRITSSGSHNGDPDWSPRGDLIAFTGRDERGVFQVYAVDPEGKEVHQLTFGPRDTMDPSWSPDGRFLAVTSSRDGRSGVFVFRLGSQDFRRVSPSTEEASQPAWSPRIIGP